MGKGSTKNERKANEKKVEEAKKCEQEARDLLNQLAALPIFQQDENYRERIKKQRGILKQAIAARKKSEAHSIAGQGGRR